MSSLDDYVHTAKRVAATKVHMYARDQKTNDTMLCIFYVNSKSR
jgi:hypothetical protein